MKKTPQPAGRMFETRMLHGLAGFEGPIARRAKNAPSEEQKRACRDFADRLLVDISGFGKPAKRVKKLSKPNEGK